MSEFGFECDPSPHQKLAFVKTNPNQGFPAWGSLLRIVKLWIVWIDRNYSSLDKIWKSNKTTLRKVISAKLTNEGLIEEQLRFITSSGIYCYLSLTTMNLWELIILTLLLLLLFEQVQKVHIVFEDLWTFAIDFISVLGIDIRNLVKNQVFKVETPVLLPYLERKL